MDPAINKYAHAVPGCTGAFVTINSQCRDEVTTGANFTMYVMIMWTRCKTGRYLKWKCYNETPGDDHGQLFWQHLSQFGSTDFPTNLRPLKQSVRIKNLTAAQNVAGQVRHLKAEELPTSGALTAPGPGVLKFSSATTSAYHQWVTADTKASGITAAELRRTHKWVLHPANMVNYAQYSPFTATYDDATALAFINEQIAKEPMNAMLFQFPPTSTPNTYEVTYHAQDAAQYPPTSVLHHQAKEMSGGQEALLRQIVQALSNAGPHVDMTM